MGIDGIACLGWRLFNGHSTAVKVRLILITPLIVDCLIRAIHNVEELPQRLPSSLRLLLARIDVLHLVCGCHRLVH